MVEVRMIYTIKSGELTVSVDDLGAEIVSVKYKGAERSWQNTDGSWSGHAPVLFPVCGNYGVVIDGVKYDMPMHGFARNCKFECINLSESSICLRLLSDEYTKKIYPYEFVLLLTYTVKNNEILITYRVENREKRELYFSLGGHDSFALSENLCRYKLIFPRKEHFVTMLHDGNGRLTGEIKDFGTGREFVLPEEFLDGKTLIFYDIKSDNVCLCDVNGRRLVESAFPKFNNLLLWRPRGAAMICVEPWLNLPDGVSEFSDEFAEKCGVIAVGVNDGVEIVRYVKYFE